MSILNAAAVVFFMFTLVLPIISIVVMIAKKCSKNAQRVREAERKAAQAEAKKAEAEAKKAEAVQKREEAQRARAEKAAQRELARQEREQRQAAQREAKLEAARELLRLKQEALETEKALRAIRKNPVNNSATDVAQKEATTLNTSPRAEGGTGNGGPICIQASAQIAPGSYSILAQCECSDVGSIPQQLMDTIKHDLMHGLLKPAHEVKMFWYRRGDAGDNLRAETQSAAQIIGTLELEPDEFETLVQCHSAQRK